MINYNGTSDCSEDCVNGWKMQQCNFEHLFAQTNTLTAVGKVGWHSRGRSLYTLRCPRRCFQEPTRPETHGCHGYFTIINLCIAVVLQLKYFLLHIGNLLYVLSASDFQLPRELPSQIWACWLWKSALESAVNSSRSMYWDLANLDLLLLFREPPVPLVRSLGPKWDCGNAVSLLKLWCHCLTHPISIPTCSCTSLFSELSSSMKMGTAPVSMTTLVWRNVPEAMLVRAQAASNCKQQRKQTIKQHESPDLK